MIQPSVTDCIYNHANLKMQTSHFFIQYTMKTQLHNVNITLTYASIQRGNNKSLIKKIRNRFAVQWSQKKWYMFTEYKNYSSLTGVFKALYFLHCLLYYKRIVCNCILEINGFLHLLFMSSVVHSQNISSLQKKNCTK